MLNPIELGAILAVAVLVFGPKKIPEIANSLGRSITEFKKGASDLEAKFRHEADPATEVTLLPPAPAGHDPMSSDTREAIEAQMRREIEEKVRREIAAERATAADPGRPTP